MSLSADAIRLLADHGLSIDEIIQVALAMESAPQRAGKSKAAGPKYRRPNHAEWTPVRLAVLERDGEVCAYCSSLNGPFEVDHVIPWTRGGSHEMDNLVVACRPCNRSKKDKTPEEWKGRTCQ